MKINQDREYQTIDGVLKRISDWQIRICRGLIRCKIILNFGTH
jgi:hypothetical protein